MPRWIRRRTAEQRYKRRRFERVVDERRRRRLIRRLFRVSPTLAETIARRYSEIFELRDELKKAYEEYKRKGARLPFLHAFTRVFAASLVDDDAIRMLEAKQYAAALALQLLNEIPFARLFMEAFFARDIEYTIPVLITVFNPKQQNIKALARFERFNHRAFPLLYRGSRVTLAQLTKHWEYIRDLVQAAIGAVLPLHEYCFETKRLVYHDGTYPTTVYIAYITVKVHHVLPGTWGLIRDVLLLLEPYTPKPEEHVMTRTMQAADEVRSDNDRVAVKTNDSRKIRVTLPLWFVELRPSRIEKAAAASHGHREDYDSVKHCSVYRLPAVHYKDDWLKLRYRGRLIRVNIRPLRKRWG